MPESTRLANEAWEALFTAQSRLLRRFQEQDAFGEVSMSEYDVLYTLSKAGEPVRMGELGCAVLLSQPGLSRLVDRLVQRGLIERCPDPADRRSVLVRLTDAGRTVQKQVGRRHARQVAEAMTVLDADELRQLRTLATKLARAQAVPVLNGSGEQSVPVLNGSGGREES
jgi:DNA-binding MarR family transcriptional regulator